MYKDSRIFFTNVRFDLFFDIKKINFNLEYISLLTMGGHQFLCIILYLATGGGEYSQGEPHTLTRCGNFHTSPSLTSSLNKVNIYIFQANSEFYELSALNTVTPKVIKRYNV